MTEEQTTLPPGKPPVLPWFTAYCGLMVITYLVVTVLGVVLLLLPPDALQASSEDVMILRFVGVFNILCGIPLAAAFAAGPFLPKKPWAWVVSLILIALCLTSLCCMPIGIPLLLFWLKPETQLYFGRTLKARTMMGS